jgi:hypothetical protein
MISKEACYYYLFSMTTLKYEYINNYKQDVDKIFEKLASSELLADREKYNLPNFLVDVMIKDYIAVGKLLYESLIKFNKIQPDQGIPVKAVWNATNEHRFTKHGDNPKPSYKNFCKALIAVESTDVAKNLKIIYIDTMIKFTSQNPMFYEFVKYYATHQTANWDTFKTLETYIESLGDPGADAANVQSQT